MASAVAKKLEVDEAWSTLGSWSEHGDSEVELKRYTLPASGPARTMKVQQATTLAATVAIAALSMSPLRTGTFQIKDASETNRSFAELNKVRMIPAAVIGLLRELYQFANLEAGWDGPESVAPEMSVIRNAHRFLLLLPSHVALPDVTASADGEVGFYWKSEGVYIDVGFPKADRISYYAKANEKVARYSGPFNKHVMPSDLLSVIENI